MGIPHFPLPCTSLIVKRVTGSINTSLFISLIIKNIPLPYLCIITHWLFHLKGCLRWDGFMSIIVEIKSGIKQGGINSPGHFNMFINDLIVKLRISGYGCFIADVFCGFILFADDILLLSASLSKLQCMLDLCVEFVAANDMKFNHLKKHLFHVGLETDVALPKLNLSDKGVAWVK